MIDKNGKLFGKINLIDLIIILVVLALAAFVVMKFVFPRDNGDGLSPVRISFYSSEEPDYVVTAIKEGDKVLDSAENVVIGTVEKVSLGEPLNYEVNTAGGEVLPVVRENCYSITVDVLANAKYGDFGATVDGVLYGVGHSLVVYAGQSKMYLRVSAIEPAA